MNEQESGIKWIAIIGMIIFLLGLIPLIIGIILSINASPFAHDDTPGLFLVVGIVVIAGGFVLMASSGDSYDKPHRDGGGRGGG